ncbi:hypothetical protein BRARA_A00513 [Brassica rapa]|uniref:Uncharacterized protein n=1 Tax=Brassica campestris TaxID=3711 RepID=A0A398AQT2_BRACM|nr:hypothetical protein BRARA_A00513 [Brassica rapa]
MLRRVIGNIAVRRQLQRALSSKAGGGSGKPSDVSAPDPLRPKLEDLELSDDPARYTGPSFEELDEKMRDVFHSFLEERGVNESLFPFLQALLYVKDHRKFAICCGGSNQLALIFSVCWKVKVKKLFLMKVMIMIWRKSMRRKLI